MSEEVNIAKKGPGRPPKDMRSDPVAEAREDMRAGQREDDPRARAERRAAEIRKHLKGDTSDGADRFWVDPAIVPDGWSYEWKRKTIWGKEDPAHEVELARDIIDPATCHVRKDAGAVNQDVGVPDRCHPIFGTG